MTAILGINAYHGDSSACLIQDGKLVAAAEEERFTRIKHWAGFPAQSIRYCLDAGGIPLSAIDHVAINQDAKANLWRKIAFTFSKRPDAHLVLDRVRTKRERANVEQELASKVAPGFSGKVHHVEHHLAHLSSAFMVSPFDEAVVVSIDGFGDFASAAWGIARHGGIQLDEKVYFPHSLGIFYEAMTQYLGFHHFGDEYKVMGLAPYGKPEYLEKLRRVVLLQQDGTFRLNLDFFQHHKQKVEYEWDNGAPLPHAGNLFSPALVDLLGPAREPHIELDTRHRDIARSVQAMYEEAFFHLLGMAHKRYGVDALALAGGCAMNSVANGKVYARTPFTRMYVQSAAGDAGGAVGAAYAVAHSVEDAGAQRVNGRRFVMDHAYWGPEFTVAQVGSLLSARQAELAAAGCITEQVDDENALCARTAVALTEGKVVGWFQGRMEWGPRALGNRSILGDPRRSDMKELLNLKIKRRESFRPFAPSILRSHVPEWFETDDDVPFMMQVFQIREEKRSSIPAVTHVDGSGRLQTVTEESNPRYFRLIDAFREITGVPMLLNTSFNENEPVVCRPEQALDCFLRTRMDVLVLGDFIVSRNG
ncbi:MAG: carbamoyltransferase [Betaproteobacteria bacterium]|nr:carbamoyltransferase [Betaproteobacteria bacterium]